MTDSQVTLILSALGAVAGGAGFMIRWAVTQVTDAIKDSSKAMRESAKEAADAARDSAKAQIEQAHALDSMVDRVDKAMYKIDRVHEWVEEHTPSPDLGVSAHPRGARRHTELAGQHVLVDHDAVTSNVTRRR